MRINLQTDLEITKLNTVIYMKKKVNKIPRKLKIAYLLDPFWMVDEWVAVALPNSSFRCR